MKKVIAAAVVALTIGAASAAQAAVEIVNFTISGDWFSSGSPFGMTPGADLTGTIYVDNALTGAASIVGIDYVTGTRTWTLADIDLDQTTVAFWSTTNTFQNASIRFTTPSNYITGTAQIRDGDDYMACNSCVTFRPEMAGVPEPATWAMLIAGFGLAGASLRRRRQAGVVA